MSNIVIHLGLHKTATTTLQTQFFPACKGINLITTLLPEMKIFMEQVTRRDELYFDSERALQIIQPVLKDGQVNLISNESLSGPPYAGVIERGLDHRSTVLRNLKSVFPNARAFIVLRRQDSLSRSFYRQYLKSGGTRKIRRFYGLDEKYTMPLMSLDRFYFFPYIDELRRVFPEGLLVLIYEEFVLDQKEFFRKISNFLGVDLPDIELRKDNASRLGPIGMEVCRILNHLFRNLLNPGGILPGIPLYRNGGYRLVSPLEIIHDRFPSRANKLNKGDIFYVGSEILKMVEDDNKRLDEEYKLGLEKYGYY